MSTNEPLAERRRCADGGRFAIRVHRGDSGADTKLSRTRMSYWIAEAKRGGARNRFSIALPLQLVRCQPFSPAENGCQPSSDASGAPKMPGSRSLVG